MYIIDKQGDRTLITATESLPKEGVLSHAKNRIKQRLSELWEYRELTQNMVIRDLKVRYKNSLLGIIWSLLNPLLMMMVFTLVFTVMRGQEIANYPVFILIGLLPWQFFANSVAGGTSSVVGNAQLINKVYFPRETLVISAVLSQLVNFLLSLLVLAPILLLFNIPFTGWILLLPVMIIIQLVFTLGVAFIVATANVFYRDVQIIMEVLLLAWFFLTPIFYGLEILPRSYELFGVNLDIWRIMLWINPMASIISNYRVIILYGAPPAFDFLIRTFITSIAILIIGILVFNAYKYRFSEEV